MMIDTAGSFAASARAFRPQPGGMFEKLDVDNSGDVNKSEFLEKAKEINGGNSTNRAEKIFEKMDLNGDQKIDKSERDEMANKIKEKLMSLKNGGGASNIKSYSSGLLLDALMSKKNDDSSQSVSSRLRLV